jgi:hypothetical protein
LSNPPNVVGPTRNYSVKLGNKFYALSYMILAVCRRFF